MRAEQAARAFAYPFRRGALRAWIPALLLVLVLPLGLVPLLGYTVCAIRASAADPAAAPPRFRLDRRLLRDGLLVLGALLLLALPFAVAAPAVYSGIRSAHVFPDTGEAFFDAAYAGVATGMLVLLPWAFALLLVAPANLAWFAVSGRPRDLLDPVAAGRRVRGAFMAWNLVTVVMVSAWAIAGVGTLLCVGAIPGAVYAMLVTAHATAILAPGEARPAQPGAAHAPAG